MQCLFKHFTSLMKTSIFLMLLATSNAFPHGGVVLEEDICLIKVGFYEAHFTVFQPESRQHEQFCEDLPDTGESIFVLEYLHDGLESLDVDFRIIENTTANGSFANENDVDQIEDIEAITVFYQPPLKNPDVFAVLHDFDQEGEFIGVVTARDDNTSKTYTAVFPFETGFTGGDIQDIAVFTLIMTIFLGWLSFLGFKRYRARQTLVPVLSVIGIVFALQSLPALAETGEVHNLTGSSERFTIEVIPTLQPIAINQIHSWLLAIDPNDGSPTDNLKISANGGMPLHDHGMQTKPVVVEKQSQNQYQINGMKFHMRGYWEVTIKIETGSTEDEIVLGFNL